MKDKKQQKKHKHIARIDQISKHVHGWYVRVRFNGIIHSKLFSDLTHGGRKQSLTAALSWRDAKEKEVGKPRTDRNIITACRSNTGVVGVRLDKKSNRYVVSWVTTEGKQGKTSVSVLLHGKEKAFQIACEKRRVKENARLFPKKEGVKQTC